MHIPDFNFKVNHDKDYLKYTELNDLFLNFSSIVKYNQYSDEISRHINDIPSVEESILKSYDKNLKLNRK